MNLTRTQVEEIINRFAGKQFIRDCKGCGACCECECVCEKKEVNKSVLLGDVLAKMAEKYEKDDEFFWCKSSKFSKDKDKIIFLWSKNGISKSLQEIVADNGWERDAKCTTCGKLYKEYPPCEHPIVQEVEVLKSPEANNLFSFLNKIFND